MPRYELIKALIADAPEPSTKGKVGTPIIGYILKNVVSGVIEVYNKLDAYSEVSLHGATNVEAKTREFEGKTIYYLKPTDGTKINEYMLYIKT